LAKHRKERARYDFRLHLRYYRYRVAYKLSRLIQAFITKGTR
jgi:hypothetical protein